MNIIESLQWRYAVKKFDKNKAIPENKVNILKEAFNLTATSYGLQTIKLIILKNKDTQKRLQEHSFNQKQISQASHLLVICIPKKFNDTYINDFFKITKETRNTPDEILNPFKEYLKGDIATKSDDEINIWNTNQAYIALGNLLNTCAIERIDSCPMEGFSPTKYDEILELEEHNLTSVLALPIGYRAEDDYMKDLKKVRKGIKNCVIEM